MNRLGIVLHVSKSKKLILRTKVKTKIGMQVLDEELKPIGRIMDVFGPLKSPYISVAPIIDGFQRYVGCPLYIVGRE